jgi:hypothetical protein
LRSAGSNKCFTKRFKAVRIPAFAVDGK